MLDKKFKNKFWADFFEIDPLTHSKARSTLLSRLVHDGMVFASSLNFTLAPSAIREFVFVTGENPPHIKQSKVTSNKEDAQIDYYEGSSTSDDGIVMGYLNLNRMSARTPSAVLHRDPTVTIDGMRISEQHINEAQLFSDEIIEGVVLKPDTKYVIRVTNMNGNNNSEMALYFTWYEIQYEDPITVN